MLFDSDLFLRPALLHLRLLYASAYTLRMASVAQSGPSGISSAGSQTGSSLSHALWGQLLHKSIPPSLNPATRGASSSIHTSTTNTAPIDRNGTSVRMLLHDTQATLEKFSTRVEKLTARVDDAKRELSTAHKVFQAGHDNLITENVDLGMCSGAYTLLFRCSAGRVCVSIVNRCQTEIKRSLGVPAQAPKLDEALKSLITVDSRVERLDRQVEALHMVSSVPSQLCARVNLSSVESNANESFAVYSGTANTAFDPDWPRTTSPASGSLTYRLYQSGDEGSSAGPGSSTKFFQAAIISE